MKMIYWIYRIKDKVKGFFFHIRFWIGKLYIKNNPNVVRINGSHFIIGEKDFKGWKGFGGRNFLIYKYGNPRIIRTDNLWGQGKIPKWIKPLLPDNAEFIEENNA